MRTKVNYEWCIEQENKDGEVVDLEFADKLSEFVPNSFQLWVGCVKATLHLVRDEYTDHEGVLDRTYAYPKTDGELAFGDWRPTKDGTAKNMVWCEYPNMKVPKKLQEEYSRFINRKAGIK